MLFTINGELFVCELGEDGVTAETRRLELTFDDDGERQYATPILNPRVSPDGTVRALLAAYSRTASDWMESAAWPAAGCNGFVIPPYASTRKSRPVGNPA